LHCLLNWYVLVSYGPKILEESSWFHCSCFIHPNLKHQQNQGSADRWDFEAAIYKSTACEIHTFDCTVDSAHIPEEIQDRVMFHKVCIGNSSKSDSSNNLIFMNLKEIMDSLGHTYMTLLKVISKRHKGLEGRQAFE
jgi:hypothetical protein